MRIVSTAVIVLLALTLGACSSNASRTFVVEVSPIGAEYTPRQIRDFLKAHGYERVPFERSDDSRTTSVLEVRTAQFDEQHFILTSAPQIELIVRLEKVKRLFRNSNPLVVVIFIENGSSSLSPMAQRHYELLRVQIAERIGGTVVN